MKYGIIGVAFFLLAGCGITKGILRSDLHRTGELLAQYSKQEDIRLCGAWLQEISKGNQALEAEETSGILSRVTKEFLLDSASMEFKQSFIKQCGGVAAYLLSRMD